MRQQFPTPVCTRWSCSPWENSMSSCQGNVEGCGAEEVLCPICRGAMACSEHGHLTLPPGIYQVTYQRQFDDEIRRVKD